MLYVSREPDSSLAYYRKALSYYQSQDDSLKVARTHRNIGKAYLIKGKSSKALSYFEKSLSFNKTSKGYLNDFLALESLISKAEITFRFSLLLRADSLTKNIQNRVTRRVDKLRLLKQSNRVFKLGLKLSVSLYKKTKQRLYLGRLFYFSERVRGNVLLSKSAGHEAWKHSK